MLVVKNAEMKAMDRYMIETMGLPGLVLMENASRTVVEVVAERFPVESGNRKYVVVLCGTGNNGGDGLCISRWLRHLGYEVMTFVIGKKEKLSTDAMAQYELLNRMDEGREETLTVFDEEGDASVSAVAEADLIIDALIGTGCSRTLSDKFIKVVRAVNASKGAVLAVDIPTGINGDNGKIMGEAVRASVTVTFCLPKLGVVLYPGAEHAGELIVSDIGILEEAYSTLGNPIGLIDRKTLIQAVGEGKLSRPRYSHKGTFGKVGIIAGDRHMIGASILAAKAAYRSGAGLVKVFVEEELGSVFIRELPECIVVAYDNEHSKERFDHELENFVLGVDSVIIGPGLSKSLKARHMVQKVLQLDTKAVFDADALNIISEHLEWFEERVASCIITPHLGEMSRLTGYPSQGISENTVQFAEAFSVKYGATTVLKSARTVIVTDRNERYINMSGNSGLATAGSGDVLAGVIGGLIAQHYPLDMSAVYGVLLHSLSGDCYAQENSEFSLIASDIINNLWKGI